VVRAIPSVAIVKDLVFSRMPLELHDEDGFHRGTVAGSRSRVDGFNGHAFGKEVELIHGLAAT
jgi:hypothetical protein